MLTFRPDIRIEPPWITSFTVVRKIGVPDVVDPPELERVSIDGVVVYRRPDDPECEEFLMPEGVEHSRLDEIEARANAAIPPPWNWAGKSEEMYPCRDNGLEPDVLYSWGYDAHGIDGDEPSMAFIAAARADIPYLLAEVRRLKALAGEG